MEKDWVLCNAKKTSIAYFEKLVGISFSDFYKKNKRACDLAWRNFVAKRRKRKPVIHLCDCVFCKVDKI